MPVSPVISVFQKQLIFDKLSVYCLNSRWLFTTPLSRVLTETIQYVLLVGLNPVFML